METTIYSLVGMIVIGILLALFIFKVLGLQSKIIEGATNMGKGTSDIKELIKILKTTSETNAHDMSLHAGSARTDQEDLIIAFEDHIKSEILYTLFNTKDNPLYNEQNSYVSFDGKETKAMKVIKQVNELYTLLDNLPKKMDILDSYSTV